MFSRKSRKRHVVYRRVMPAAGLVSEDVIFRDALLECRGLPAWLEYAEVCLTSVTSGCAVQDLLSSFIMIVLSLEVLKFTHKLRGMKLYGVLQRVEQTGGYIELANIWGSASEDRCNLTAVQCMIYFLSRPHRIHARHPEKKNPHMQHNKWSLVMSRPDPQWHVVVDSWLNIPYPDWYLDYFMTLFDASHNPQAFLGAFAAAMADSGKVRHPDRSYVAVPTGRLLLV